MNYKNDFKMIEMEADSVYTTLSRELKVPQIREDPVKEYRRKGN